MTDATRTFTDMATQRLLRENANLRDLVEQWLAECELDGYQDDTEEDDPWSPPIGSLK